MSKQPGPGKVIDLRSKSGSSLVRSETSAGVGIVSSSDQDLLALSTEELQAWVENAEPSTIQSYVNKRGIEECALLIHHIPSEKLRVVLDLDTWKRSSDTRMGEDFEPAQFMCWLKALISVEAEHAVNVFCDLGIEHCAGLLAHFIESTPMEMYSMNRAESGLGVEDKDVEHGDPLELGIFGGCYVRLLDFGKNTPHDEVQDIFLDFLGAFEEVAPEFLQGVFYHRSRMDSDDVVLDDFRWDRITRLSAQGYIPSFKALEILLRARAQICLEAEVRIARVWQVPLHESLCAALLKFSQTRKAFEKSESPKASENPKASRSLSLIGERRAQPRLFDVYFEWANEQGGDLVGSVGQELSWLSNLLVAGWTIGGEPMGPRAAAQATTALIELGLSLLSESLEKPGNETEDDLIPRISRPCQLFELAWQSLYRKVSLPAARALDKRLKERSPENTLLREAWFRSCKRRKMETYGIEYWIRQGRYALVREVISEVEYALGLEASYWAFLLLDELPRFPKGPKLPLGLTHANVGSFKPQWRHFSRTEDYAAALLKFKAALAN